MTDEEYKTSLISNRLVWKKFFHQYYKEKMLNEINNGNRTTLDIDYNDIIKFNVYLGWELLNNPGKVYQDALEGINLVELPIKDVAFKPRIKKINKKFLIRNLRSSNIQKIVSLDCSVRKITGVKPRIINAAFECARCGEIHYIKQDGEGKFLEPSYCTCNEEKKGIFRLVFKESKFEDHQKARVQESFESLKGGEQPQFIDVNLTDDLAGVLKPGHHCVINGILRSYQKTNKDGKTIYFETCVDAISIELDDDAYDDLEISSEDEKKIKEIASQPQVIKKIANSIAPTIIGIQEVKEAISLQLFSGITKHMPDGTRIRGDSHILLVGDPGLAKSQILNYIVGLAPKGMYANGRSTSGAGLTAAAIKDDFSEQWSLEAGVLVLADRGIACVDEFEKMREEDRSSMHQAMEQQSVTMAKAGIFATLFTRCSVLAAANPKLGKFDQNEPFTDQVDLKPSLISRFDLIFLLFDIPNKEDDRKIGSHILKVHEAGEFIECKNNLTNSGIKEDELEKALESVKPDIEPEILRKYIAYARKHIYPRMTSDTREYLLNYYIQLRNLGDGISTPMACTARTMEGLIRLAESSAKMRLSNIVTLDDAKIAADIMNKSLRMSFTDKDGNIDIDIKEIGVGKSQREKFNDLLEIMRSVQDKNGSIPLEEFYKKLEELHVPIEDAKKQIKSLLDIGNLMREGEGYVRIT